MVQILKGAIRYILTSPSNKGQKFYRIVLAFIWQFYKRIVGLPIISKLDNGKYFILYPKSTNSTANIYVRTYEAEYIYFLRQHLSAGGIMIDIGAHMGIYALLLADKFQMALCLEPSDDNFLALENNLFLNRLANFYPLKIAASNKSGSVNFVKTGVFSGTNTVSESGDGIEIKAVTVDDLICDWKINAADISFVKIDTEGHEFSVLQGMTELLMKNPSLLILTENSSYNDVKNFYNKFSYKMFAIDKSGNIITDSALVSNSYNYFSIGPLHPLYNLVS